MNEQKGKPNLIEQIRKIKMIKTIIAACGGSSFLLVCLVVILVAAVVVILPVFVSVAMSEGDTVYGNSAIDLPTELAANGIETWTDEQKQIFEDYKNQKNNFDNGFTYYNVSNIKKDSSEQFDISMPLATVHYQGNVGLTSYDDEYLSNLFDTEYQGESIVNDSKTRDFFKQAGEYTGNNFIVYPGKRLLLGHLVSNEVTFSTVEYEEWECGDDICNNSNEIYSQWSYLGKITSSNEEDAKKSYSVSESINKMTEAINFGENNCQNATNIWLKQNYCYDTDLLYSELFGKSFEITSQSIVSYLEEQYKAKVPTSGTRFIVGNEYISVSVKKNIDYDLYQDYLKKVYIPYIYINCHDCAYRNASEDLKTSEAESINTEIMSFVDAFKYFNNEDTIGEYYLGSGYFGGGGTATIPGVSYECGTYRNGISSDYSGHRANDLYSTAPTNPNIYPLMEGTVVDVVNSCHNICPVSDANRYVGGAALSSLSSACQCGGGWGNHVQIQSTYNGQTIYAIYAHLSSVNVSVGDSVTYDTILGVMGTTGVSTGNHLHIELSYTGQSADKFPATTIFSEETVLGTLCRRTFDSGEVNE